MPIPLLDLTQQYRSLQPAIDAAVRRVLESGQFILGPEVRALEDEVAAYLRVDHGVGLASGTDALILALRALDIGPGDEVIVPAFTFFATAGAVLHVDAAPVLADIELDTYSLDPEQVERLITPRTKAIIPVHLYGHPAHMDAILEIARRQGLKVIEDNAQAFGAEYHGTKTGALGDIACLSFFPSKNLGAYGDAGMIVTNSAEAAERVRRLRAHGWQKKYFPLELGYNSRLDALQAAILRVKLPHVDAWNDLRRTIAAAYRQGLGSTALTLPSERTGCTHVYHQFVVRTPRRDALRQHLKAAGIGTDVYYPQPLHLTGPLKFLGYTEGSFPRAEQAVRECLALPIFPELTQEQQDLVIAQIRNFLA
jgi:dTDP-4-amino-4,6-dideoxygalactose transaminase